MRPGSSSLILIPLLLLPACRFSGGARCYSRCAEQGITRPASTSEGLGTELNLLTVPVDVGYDQWADMMIKYDGRVVHVVGCAERLYGFSGPRSAFVLMPCKYMDYTPDGVFKERAPEAEPMGRRLVVRPGASEPRAPLAARIRVTGRLRVGRVLQSIYEYAWAELENARWEPASVGQK